VVFLPSRPTPILTALLVTAALGFAPLAGLAQDRPEIGVTAALNPNATGTPPQSEPRILDVGVNVFADERIVTSDGGQAQMLFIDESAFTVGPNSEVVLDEFVFDPDTGTGRLALTATKGVFRFVGGKISKRTPVTLKTPTAVIGIRGGIALVNVQPSGATQATFLFGDQMTVAAAGVTQTARRPGFAISAESADAPPSEPAPAPPAQLNAALNSLERSAPPADDGDEGQAQGGGQQQQQQQQQAQSDGQGGGGQAQSGDGAQQQAGDDGGQASGQSGGPRQVPTDQDVAQTSLGQQGSQRPPRAIAPPTILAVAAPPVAPVPGGNAPGDTANEAQQNNVQQNLLPSASSLSGRFKRSTSRANGTNDTSSSDNIPFQGGDLNSGSFSVPLGSSTLKFPVIATGVTGIQSASATDSPNGTFTGDVFLAANLQFLFLEGKETADQNNRIIAFAGQPTTSFPTSGATFYALQNDFGLDSGVPFMRRDDVGGITVPQAEGAADAAIYWDISGSSTAQRSFGFRTISIDGQGTSQKSLISIGGGEVRLDSQNRAFIGGGAYGSVRSNLVKLPSIVDTEISSADDNLGNDFFGTNAGYFVLESANVNTSDTVVDNDGASVFVPGNSPPTTNFFPTSIAVPASSTLASRTTRTMGGFVAGAYQTEVSGTLSTTTLFDNETDSGTDVTLKTSAAANKAQAVYKFSNAFSSGPAFQVLFGDKDIAAFGDASNSTSESVFIDDETVAAADQDGGVTINSVQKNNSNLAFVSVSEASDFSNGFLPSGVSVCDCKYLSWGFWGGRVTDGGSSSEIIHLANYVTGQISGLAAINSLQGTATYAGHAIGTVFENSQVYQAIGNLSVTVNFDNTSASTFNITDFDGANYSGTGLTIAADGSGHKFTGSIAGSGRTGSYTGAFMSGGGAVNAEMGGQFKVDGGGYSAIGIFAGKK